MKDPTPDTESLLQKATDPPKNPRCIWSRILTCPNQPSTTRSRPHQRAFIAFLHVVWTVLALGILVWIVTLLLLVASGSSDGVAFLGGSSASAGSGWDWRRWWRLHSWDRSLSDVCPFEDLDLPNTIFLENREKLFKHLAEAIRGEAAAAAGNVQGEQYRVLLTTAPRPQRDESDAEFPGWKQTPNVEYLIGPLAISGAAIVLTPNTTLVHSNQTLDEPMSFTITLYLPEQPEREAVFTGTFPSKEYLMKAHGLDDVKSIKELPGDLSGCALGEVALERRGRRGRGRRGGRKKSHGRHREGRRKHHDDDDEEEEDDDHHHRKYHNRKSGKPKHHDDDNDVKSPTPSPSPTPASDHPEEDCDHNDDDTPTTNNPLTGPIRILTPVMNPAPTLLPSSLTCASVTPSMLVWNAFARARFVKSGSELVALKRAGNLAAWAHRRAEEYLLRARRANEVEVAAEFVGVGGVCGGWLQAYSPIVGAGPHGAILHYRTGENLTAGYAPIPPETLVLIDASPEYHGYASDLTRTYIRGGHPTKVSFSLGHAEDAPTTPQAREVLGIVKRVQEHAVRMLYGEGRWWYRDVVDPVMEMLTRELRDAG
ncbi:hypothetical protein HDU67_008155, partial [Dinochytrium kinnereticum]